MRKVLALALRELQAYFNSPLAYIVLTAFLALSGLLFMINMFIYSESHVPARYVDTMNGLSYLTVLLTPFITMRLIAEEKNRGTIETLLTAPISEWSVVLVKFFAALAFFAYLMVFTLLHVVLLGKYGLVDWGAVGMGYLGLLLLAGAILSIGIFVSSLCGSQIVAGIVTFIISFVLLAIQAATIFFREEDSIARQVLTRISFTHNNEPFAMGILDSRPLFYFLSFTIFFLFATVKVLESHRWRSRAAILPLFFLSLLLLLGNLVVLNLGTYFYYVRKDLTSSREYELEPRTINVLKRLDHDVYLYSVPVPEGTVQFQDESLPTAWAMFYKKMDEFKKYTDRLKVKNLRDSDIKDQDTIRKLFGETSANMIYLFSGEGEQIQKKSFGIKDLYKGDEKSGRIFQFAAEPKIVMAISQMMSRQRLTVYVTTGHREHVLDDPGPSGFRFLKMGLEISEGAQFHPLHLFSMNKIPADCDLLMILSPENPFKREELEVLRDYLKNGGRLFATVKPSVETNLDGLMAEWGIVLDKRSVISGEYPEWGLIMVTDFRNHPVNQGWQGARVEFPLASVVGTVQQPPAGVLLQSLIFAGKDCAAVTPSKPGQQPLYEQGPHPVAAAASSEKKDGKRDARIIVWGSGVGVANLAVRQLQSLPLYFANNLKWLVERENEIVAGPQRKIEEEPLRLSSSDRWVIGGFACGLIPLVGIMLGITTWFFRRK